MSAKGHPAPNRKPKGEALKNEVLRFYKRNARNRGLEWSLTDEQFKVLIMGSCRYCGAVSSMTLVRPCLYGELVYNGVDRKDNDLGYTVGNSVSCCKTCQKMKGTMTYEEFISQAKSVAEFAHIAQSGQSGGL